MIGATGAIGREIVDYIKQDSRFSEVILLCRRPLAEWKPEEFKPTLTIVEMENFDSFDSCKERLRNVDAFLCCLGTRVKVGEENFIRVDYKYPLEFAKLSLELNAKHYGLLSSNGASSTSLLLYMRTKGRVE